MVAEGDVVQHLAVRPQLYEADIFPAVHWPQQNLTPDDFHDCHRLANHIMTYPCDQRYSSLDMERMCDVLLKAAA